MKKLLLSTLILASTLSAQAGDNGGGQLSCESASGRTTITGMAGTNYNGSGRAELVLSVDGKELILNERITQVLSKEPTSIVDATYFEPKQNLYLVKFIEKVKSGDYSYTYDIFELVADTKSMKQVSSAPEFTFKAKLFSVDPRAKDPVKSEFLRDIQLNCTLNVGI